jgi:predicted metalloprotease with PDZ domain
VKRVTVAHATGDVTARSVGLLRELDGEIRRVSGGRKNLDDVVRAMVEVPQSISLAHFRSVSERVAGGSLAAFFDRSIVAPPD